MSLYFKIIVIQIVLDSGNLIEICDVFSLFSIQVLLISSIRGACDRSRDGVVFVK